MEVEEIHCTDVEAFLSLMRRSNSRWFDSQWHECRWLFRGIGEADWPVIPSLWRDSTEDLPFHSEAEDAARAYAESVQSPEFPKESLYRIFKARLVEFIAVRNFCKLSDELGFRLPGYSWKMPIWDPNSIFRKNDQEPAFPASFGLARHHGCPSQLLDWTKNPLIAAWFAATGSDQNKPLAVWAVHQNAAAEYTKLRLLQVPRADVGYLHRQEALFTYYVDPEPYVVAHGTWPTVEQMVNRKWLRKVVLPGELRKDLLARLYAERISQAHLMPTFDNVFSEIKRVSIEVVRQAVKAASETLKQP